MSEKRNAHYRERENADFSLKESSIESERHKAFGQEKITDEAVAQNVNYHFFSNARTIEPIDLGDYCSLELLEENRKILRTHA